MPAPRSPPPADLGTTMRAGVKIKAGVRKVKALARAQGLGGFGSSCGSGAAIGPGSGSEATRSDGLDTLLVSSCFFSSSAFESHL